MAQLHWRLCPYIFWWTEWFPALLVPQTTVPYAELQNQTATCLEHEADCLQLQMQIYHAPSTSKTGKKIPVLLPEEEVLRKIHVIQEGEIFMNSRFLRLLLIYLQVTLKICLIPYVTANNIRFMCQILHHCILLSLWCSWFILQCLSHIHQPTQIGDIIT